MRYIIVHLIRGEAKKAHEAITKDLATRFNSFPIHERLPPHLTIKRWFEIDDKGMAVVRNTLDAFIASHTQSDYNLSEFNHFGDGVIYVDVKASQKMLSDIGQLKDSLRQVENLTFDEFEDRELVLHATVAMKALRLFDFTQLWDYLQTTNAPNFDLRFDNIALMKKETDTWVMDTVWELRP